MKEEKEKLQQVCKQAKEKITIQKRLVYELTEEGLDNSSSVETQTLKQGLQQIREDNAAMRKEKKELQ